MSRSQRSIAVLGATGRIGAPLVAGAAAAGVQVFGLSRRPPAAVEAFARWVEGDRRDPAAVARAIDGADAVIDLCAFDAADADALVAAWEQLATPPRRWVFASSMAERPIARWAQHPADFAALDAEPAPAEDYGAGKRRVRQRVAAALGPGGVAVVALLLPQVWDAAALSGRRQGLGGSAASAQGRPCVVLVETVVAALSALAIAGPELAGPWQLAPAMRPERAALLAATGGIDAFSAGDEPVDGAPLRAAVPQLPWPDLVEAIAASRRPG